jgi:hypothetical protein
MPLKNVLQLKYFGTATEGQNLIDEVILDERGMK